MVWAPACPCRAACPHQRADCAGILRDRPGTVPVREAPAELIRRRDRGGCARLPETRVELVHAGAKLVVDIGPRDRGGQQNDEETGDAGSRRPPARLPHRGALGSGTRACRGSLPLVSRASRLRFRQLACTLRLFTTSRTPFTSPASCAARTRISSEDTVPFSATTPWLVSTSIRVTVEIFSPASFALTFAVMPASSMFSPSVLPVMLEHAASSIMIATATPIIRFTVATRAIRIIVRLLPATPPARLLAGERQESKERAPAGGHDRRGPAADTTRVSGARPPGRGGEPGEGSR